MDLAAEVKRALKRPDLFTPLKADRDSSLHGAWTPTGEKLVDDEIRDSRKMWGKAPKPLPLMTEREIRAELGRQAKRLS
jgi:hypothetical protein